MRYRDVVMKTLTQTFRYSGLVLLLGTVSLSAQSCAAVNTFGNASTHAVNASGEVLASGAASVKGSVEAASAVVAVPVWMSGAVVTAGGAVSSAVGDAASKGGESAMHGAEKLWDFSTGDASQRPMLDRDRGVPTAPAAIEKPSARAKDPSPAEALKRS
jgi:hypothetical protein